MCENKKTADIQYLSKLITMGGELRGYSSGGGVEGLFVGWRS